MIRTIDPPSKAANHVTLDGRVVAPVGTLDQMMSRAMTPRYRRRRLDTAELLDDLLEMLEDDPRRRQLISDRLGVRR